MGRVSNSEVVYPYKTKSYFHLVIIIVSLIFLSVLYNLPLLLHTQRIFVLLKLPIDMMVLQTIIFILSFSMRFKRSVYIPMCVLYFAALFFRFADKFVPAVYSRKLTLYEDIGYIRDLFNFIKTVVPSGLFILLTTASVLMLTLLIITVWKTLKFLHSAFGNNKYRLGILSALGTWIMISTFQAAVSNNPESKPVTASVLPRVIEEIKLARNMGKYWESQQEIVKQREEITNSISGVLDKLDMNVYLFIVESYGYTVFSNSEHFDLIDEDFALFDADLTASGFSIYSNYLNSPVFGGNSWLSEATLATGLWIDDQDTFELLLQSDVKTLMQFFNEAGYETISVMPATIAPWPEGDFYGFTKKYYNQDFEYHGPVFGWAPMSDQYVLNFIQRREVETTTNPLFIQYVLISSHYPYNTIPQYLDDWSVIGDGSIYHERELVLSFSNNPFNETSLSEGFMMLIQYVLQVIKGYILTFIEDDSLVIIIGDHQPWSGISGKNQPWSVPIHVISRDNELLAPFRNRGYTAGVVPRQPPPHSGMETFFNHFLTDFSSQPIPGPNPDLK